MTFKRFKKLGVSIAALAITALAAGGGGGGGTSSTTTDTTQNSTNRVFTVSGTLATGGIGRAAGRAASAPVASTQVIAYVLGDGNHTALNTPSTTDANGNFTILVNIGSAENADIIIEALTGAAGTVTNVKIPLENAAGDTTGVTGNDATSAQALLWSFAVSEGFAATIKPAVDMFTNQGIDIRNGVTSSTEGRELVEIMKTIISQCGSQTGTAQKTCVITQIETAKPSIQSQSIASLADQLENEYVQDKVETDAAGSTQADKLKYLSPAQSYDTINALIAIAQEAALNETGVNLATIDQSAESDEMFDKMSDAVTEQGATFTSSLARSVAVKNQVVASLNALSFVSADVNDLLYYIKSGLTAGIGAGAAALTTRTNSTNMTSIISGYDVIRGAFAEVFAKQGGASRDTSWAMVTALIYCLSKLGESSENNGSMQAILDDWVIAWDVQIFRDQLHTLLDPLEMTDRTKTQYLMLLAHDLGDTDGSRAAVLTVLNSHKALGRLNQNTVDYTMVLYDKYYGKMDCQVSYTTKITIGGTNCITVDEIVTLMEYHFEKSLPKLEAVLNGIVDWVGNSANTAKMAAVANAWNSLQPLYNDMKTSPAAKSELGTAFDAAGIAKELFWLAINLEPYVGQ